VSAPASVPGALPPFREAFVLPAMFLTVAFVAGFRMSPQGVLQLVPPSLITLVLSVLLLGVMARSGLLQPELLVGEERTPLENTCGGAVLLSLFLANAQLFNCLTPATGLLRALVVLFFVFLLFNTLAAQPDRVRLLRSLLVVFGGIFVLKFVVLAALYEPEGGMLKRVLTAMLEGVSLGSLEHTPDAPAVGYVAFFSIGLYFIGLVMLPRPRVTTLALRRVAPPGPDDDLVTVEQAGR
jgi:hypothetical protein